MHKLEKEFGIDICKICKYQTPAAPKFAVQRPTSNNFVIPAEMQKRYRIAVGLMLFLIKFSRPYISITVRELTKGNDRAPQENFKQMLCTVKSVLDTRTKTLRFKLTENEKEDELLEFYGYCDSDCAGDKERVSVSGFCVFVT